MTLSIGESCIKNGINNKQSKVYLLYFHRNNLHMHSLKCIFSFIKPWLTNWKCIDLKCTSWCFNICMICTLWNYHHNQGSSYFYHSKSLLITILFVMRTQCLSLSKFSSIDYSLHAVYSAMRMFTFCEFCYIITLLFFLPELFSFSILCFG